MKRIMMAFMVLSLMSFSTPAFAQTPDGETPAEEEFCDILLGDGITPGLFGLCIDRRIEDLEWELVRTGQKRGLAIEVKAFPRMR